MLYDNAMIKFLCFFCASTFLVACHEEEINTKYIDNIQASQIRSVKIRSLVKKDAFILYNKNPKRISAFVSSLKRYKTTDNSIINIRNHDRSYEITVTNNDSTSHELLIIRTVNYGGLIYQSPPYIILKNNFVIETIDSLSNSR